MQTISSPSRANVAPRLPIGIRCQSEILSAANLLLIEDRDEVYFALEDELHRLGFEVYRATKPDAVFRIYHRIDIRLIIANSGLPLSSIWLTTAKLRITDPLARIWLFSASLSSRELEWLQWSGIEKVIDDDGCLQGLTQCIVKLLEVAHLCSAMERLCQTWLHLPEIMKPM